MYETLAVLAGFGLVYSALAGRIERSWVSGPMVFILFGLFLGPLGVGLVSMESDPELLKTMAELTLAIVLFTDAAGADLKVLSRVRELPMRLLGIGLPLTIALGFGVGYVLFDAMTAIEIALIATMLAPTDAALGAPVVSNEAVPASTRQGLNVESGLNDGICVPILYLFLQLAGAGVGDDTVWHVALELVAMEVGVGLVVGLSLAAASAWLLRTTRARGWISPSWTTVTVVAIAFTAFGTAQALDGSGFIASFSGGLLFGKLMGSQHEELFEAAEGTGQAFGLLTWALFGAAVLHGVFDVFSWQIALYAVLSLTVIRMLPVALCVAGLGVGTEGKLFLGWFGPRGLASIVFAVIVLGEDLPHGETISALVTVTVLLSIIAHGVTANPWAGAFGARAAARSSGA